MKKLSFTSILFLLTAISSVVCAQTKSSDSLYQYYNGPHSKKTYPQLHTNYTSAAKLNLSAMVRADYCVSYETRINGFISGEVTAGFTHYDQLRESLDFFNYRPRNMAVAKRKYSTSPSLKLALRHYFRNRNSISGAYLACEGMYRRYGYTAKSVYTSPGSVKEISDQKEIRLLWGCQNIERKGEAFYDCSIGMGYRFHERKYLGYRDSYTYSAQDILTGTKNYLVFVINIKVGLAIN